MEVELLGVEGAPDGAVVSIRAGSQRKQAAVSAIGKGNSPFRFAAGPAGVNPFRVDLLRPAGSKRLALNPQEEGNYAVELKGAGETGDSVFVRFAVHEKGKQPGLPVAAVEEPVKPKQSIAGFDMSAVHDKAADPQFQQAATAAKQYLEEHKLLPFVRSLLQTVVLQRPVDPYGYIAEQFQAAGRAAARPAQPEDFSLKGGFGAYYVEHFAGANAATLEKVHAAFRRGGSQGPQQGSAAAGRAAVATDASSTSMMREELRSLFLESGQDGRLAQVLAARRPGRPDAGGGDGRAEEEEAEEEEPVTRPASPSSLQQQPPLLLHASTAPNLDGRQALLKKATAQRRELQETLAALRGLEAGLSCSDLTRGLGGIQEDEPSWEELRTAKLRAQRALSAALSPPPAAAAEASAGPAEAGGGPGGSPAGADAGAGGEEDDDSHAATAAAAAEAVRAQARAALEMAADLPPSQEELSMAREALQKALLVHGLDSPGRGGAAAEGGEGAAAAAAEGGPSGEFGGAGRVAAAGDEEPAAGAPEEGALTLRVPERELEAAVQSAMEAEADRPETADFCAVGSFDAGGEAVSELEEQSGAPTDREETDEEFEREPVSVEEKRQARRALEMALLGAPRPSVCPSPQTTPTAVVQHPPTSPPSMPAGDFVDFSLSEPQEDYSVAAASAHGFLRGICGLVLDKKRREGQEVQRIARMTTSEFHTERAKARATLGWQESAEAPEESEVSPKQVPVKPVAKSLVMSGAGGFGGAAAEMDGAKQKARDALSKLLFQDSQPLAEMGDDVSSSVSSDDGEEEEDEVLPTEKEDNEAEAERTEGEAPSPETSGQGEAEAEAERMEGETPSPQISGQGEAKDDEQQQEEEEEEEELPGDSVRVRAAEMLVLSLADGSLAVALEKTLRTCPPADDVKEEAEEQQRQQRKEEEEEEEEEELPGERARLRAAEMLVLSLADGSLDDALEKTLRTCPPADEVKEEEAAAAVGGEEVPEAYVQVLTQEGLPPWEDFATLAKEEVRSLFPAEQPAAAAAEAEAGAGAGAGPPGAEELPRAGGEQEEEERRAGAPAAPAAAGGRGGDGRRAAGRAEESRGDGPAASMQADEEPDLDLATFVRSRMSSSLEHLRSTNRSLKGEVEELGARLAALRSRRKH